MGEVYNVDSQDEVSNFDLAITLLRMSGITDTDAWIQWTRDRPFNDRRYIVDGSKLRKLGWKQRVPFDVGLAATVDWYAKFADWWGPIDNTLLAAFPVVKGGQVVEPEGSRVCEAEALAGAAANRASKASMQNGAEEYGLIARRLDSGVGQEGQGGGAEGAESKKRKVESMA